MNEQNVRIEQSLQQRDQHPGSEYHPHHILAALAALRVPGRYRAQLEARGGADALCRNPAAALQVFAAEMGKEISDPARVPWALEQAGLVDAFAERGGTVLGAGGPHELGRLTRAPAPPWCVFAQGNVVCLAKRPVVAVVGTRHPSPKGLERARRIAGELTRAGVLVVSGGAVGIDTAAHEGAVAAGGGTVAVLGTPLRPGQPLCPGRLSSLWHGGLLTVLTPFGPWVEEARFLFAVRNQYMAAVADAVIVVQGGVESGTLHTVRYAKRLSVPVWAVPGEPEDPLAGAANGLLQQGQARAYVDGGALLDELFGRQPKSAAVPLVRARRVKAASAQMPLVAALPAPVSPPRAVSAAALSGTQARVVELLRKQQGVASTDELCHKLNVNIPQLQECLLQLELLGYAAREGERVLLKETKA
ncbi:MAG: DNA-processing protein DprA [Myxococcota bacterium]